MNSHNSSQNAYKHGVYAKQLRLHPDEAADFEQFRKSLLIDLKPDGGLQSEIFTRLLRTCWTLRRLDRQEDDAFCESGRLPLANSKEFENTLRYRRYLSKEYRELIAELRRLQTEAATRELGADSAALKNFSCLVAVQPLVNLHNSRCATKNKGIPVIEFGAAAARDKTNSSDHARLEKIA